MATPQCSNCFYGQTTQSVSGQTRRVCRRNFPIPVSATPALVSGVPESVWPPVDDDDWCGLGADNMTGISYSASITTGQQIRGGTFQLSAAVSTTVADARVDAQSTILFYPTNASAAELLAGYGGWTGWSGGWSITGPWPTGPAGLYVSATTPGVGFTVTVANGVAALGTETFGYLIIG